MDNGGYGRRDSIFYKGYEILGNAGEGVKPEESVREQVGDISFGGGALSQITVKDERIGGKLLSISDDEVEIEGYGKLSVADNCAGYRLYEDFARPNGRSCRLDIILQICTGQWKGVRISDYTDGKNGNYPGCS